MMNHTPVSVSQPRDYKMIVEKDVRIPMRDGTMLYADIFRPDGGDERFPAVMNISVYQKDKLWVPPEDLEEKANPHMNWETVNPLWWCPRGFAVNDRHRLL
jgi:predicted acyl esterase